MTAPVHARLLTLAALVGALSCHAPNSDARDAEDGRTADADGWIALFDGETLDGWTPKIVGHAAGEDPYHTFRVEDDLLKVRYDQYQAPFDNRFGHLFHENAFSHYLLRVEYRFVGEQVEGGPGWAFRNSGLMLHGQRPETMGINQSFPVSIEMQLLGGDGQNERSNANVCTPGTHIVMNGELDTRHCINSASVTCHGDAWYTVTVEVRGGEVVRHYLEGEQVMEYEQPQLDPNDPTAQPLIPADGELLLTGGTISLQSESHPMDYRKVEIKLLDR